MYKKIISVVLSFAALSVLCPAATTFAVQTAESHSVSESSAKTGVKIAGKDKTPSLYVDSADYESVLLAASNLKTDIETITSRTALINTAPETDKASISSINSASKTMTIANYSALTKTGRGVIAIYNPDGTLENVYLSDNTAGSECGELTFSSMPDLSGKRAKGFLWESENGLSCRPLTDVYTYKEQSGDDLSSYDIIIGTIGHSSAIDMLAAQNVIDISEIDGKWESFTIQPHNNQIIIVGSDKRGTIFGVYDLCEKIGVSPWAWWADAVPERSDDIYVNLPSGGYTEGEPSVKYRGIFLNDEYNFCQWSKALSKDGQTNMSPEVYERVFELLLRLKANTVWPAMHTYSNAFHSDPDNAKMADKYGIVIGSSHAEPLLRNNLGELYNYQQKWIAEHADKTLYFPSGVKDDNGKAVAYMWTDHDNNQNPCDNKEFLTDYWRDCVKENGVYENIYTLGMRGVHDGSFSTNMDRITALNEIISVQRQILKEEVADKQGISITEIPQVFIPYKDVQELYNTGRLSVPDDVTIMWTDDNYGYVRQNANDAERARAGRTGIYYHVSYYGYPSSYLWLSTTQPGLIREELSKSYDMGADKLWILNVGDLKPAEKEIEYFARLARNVEKTRSADISDIYASNAQRDFGMNADDAHTYAQIMDKFYELANARRPDFFRTNDADNNLTLSVSAYGDEAERYITQYNDICSKAEDLYNALPSDKKAAFFELALYPIRSSRNMAVNYVMTERAKLYNEQGRGTAAKQYAEQAKAAAAQISADIEAYNTMLGGKWNMITNINPSRLQGCDAHITLDLNASVPSSLDYTSLAVMTDSQTEYSDEPSMTISPYDSYDKFIDVINRGYGSFEYTVTSDSRALVFDKTSGTAYGSDRVRVSVDKSKATSGTSAAVITISQMLDGNIVDAKDIAVTIENPAEITAEKTYVEAGGVVSIEAEHYSASRTNGVYEWRTEKDFGRSGDSMKIYPDIAPNANEANLAESAAYLEYDVYFTNTGTYTWDIYRMPTLDERNNARFAVSLDGGVPVVLSGNSKYSGSQNKKDAWANGVLANSQKLSTTVTIASPGMHKLRIYNVAPGVVIDKMALSKNSIYSYFGAPESYNTTYNTEKLPAVTANEPEPEIDVAKIYEPRVLVSGITKNANTIGGIELYRLDETLEQAVVLIAGYDENGNTTSAGIAKAEINGTKTVVDADITLAPDTAGYTVYVVDNLTDMQVIAPYKTYGGIKSEADSDYISLKTVLNNYIGKKSIVLIADCEIDENLNSANITHVYGEALTMNSYKFIPFNHDSGKYYIRTGVNDIGAFDEIKDTRVNILPDNDGAQTYEETWSFDSGLSSSKGTNAFALTGGASRTDDGRIKMNTTSTGTAKMEYENAIAAAQGQTITIEFDITFGKLTGKTMTYSITDANGASLVSAQIQAYDMSGNTNVMIGGSNVLTDYSILNAAVSRVNNEAKNNKPTHFKNVIDFAANKATIYVSAEGTTPAEFTGRLSQNTGSVKGVNFITSYNNDARSCYVDNVSLSCMSGPQYAMTFTARDDVTDEPINAQITVKDSASGSVIASENGKYMLCEGNYVALASADGYRDTEYKLELSPALEDKNVVIPMRSLSSLEPANITIEFKDSDGSTIIDSITPEGAFYIGDIYEVPARYQTDQIIKADGKAYKYKYMPEASRFKSDSLEENNIFTMIYNMDDTYDLYEDFNDYDTSAKTWHKGDKSGDAVVAEENGNKYLSYALPSSTTSSTGVWTPLDNKIDCNGMAAIIEADVRFAPTGTTGEAQFAISSSSPTFSSNKIGYGVKGGNGHILVLQYMANNKLVVNGSAVSENLTGSWFHIKADADFNTQKLSVTLSNNEGKSVTIENLAFFSSDVNEIGSMYLRAAGPNGTVGLDNLTILSRPSTSEIVIPDTPLYQKTVYAFGDSIVEGHNAKPQAFMRVLANDYGINLNMMAKNGASVMKSSNWITTQINNAPNEAPDIVVFDGYTNDAYGDPASDSFNTSNKLDVTKNMGKIQGSSVVTFDNTTFCGAFEELIYTMKQKWPDAKLVFVTIHKSGGRDFAVQTLLVEKTLEICEAWGVEVVDMFNECELDTRNVDEMKKYIIGGAGSHPNLECVKTYYEPMVAAKLESFYE